jgi:hypothetical protein
MYERCPHCGAPLPATGDAFCPDCRNDLTEPSTSPIPVQLRPKKQIRRKTPSVWITQGLLLVLATYCGIRVLLALRGFNMAQAWPYAVMIGRNAIELAIMLWPVVALQRRHRGARLIAGLVLLMFWGIVVFATVDSIRDELNSPTAKGSSYWASPVTMIILMHVCMAFLVFRLCFGNATRDYLTGDALVGDAEPSRSGELRS